MIISSISDFSDPIKANCLEDFLEEKVASYDNPSEIVLSQMIDRYLKRKGNDAVFFQGRLWIYSAETGCYHILEEATIAKALYAIDGCAGIKSRMAIRQTLVSQCLTSLKNRLADNTYFKNTPVGIAVKNGFLAVKHGSHTGESKVVLEPHSIEHRQRAYVSIGYNLDADTSMIDRFMDQILPQPEVRDFIYEVMPYYFVASYYLLLLCFQARKYVSK